MPAVPTIFVAFTNHPHLDHYDLSSLMGCFSGGAPLPPEVCRQFEEKTGSVIFEGYGLSETAPIASVNPTNQAQRKIGTIGFPIPGTDIKILDIDTGLNGLPQGEDGEIAICGPQVMQGYWRRPDENEKVFREVDGKRYFLTGDIGHIDDEGYILITDRKKDMMLVGGFNVYPRDVEDILFITPKWPWRPWWGCRMPRAGKWLKPTSSSNPAKQPPKRKFLIFARKIWPGTSVPKSLSSGMNCRFQMSEKFCAGC